MFAASFEDSQDYPICGTTVCVSISRVHFEEQEVIINLGDSNSDTGGYVIVCGMSGQLPKVHTFNHDLAGRMCDGRLVIDFLCESVGNDYLTPFMESIGTNFTNGVNFAIAGSKTLPRFDSFNLHIQISQFKECTSHIDIGQNDLDGLSYEKAILKIPDIISEIENAIKAMYEQGGKNFWVHNTGPLGCLPKSLATYKKYENDYDEHGCLISLNEGFVNPLMACCGYGGKPYDFESNNKCGQGNYTICEDRSKYISWDGVHYTEAANGIVASKILSTHYFTPPLKFNNFCNISP
ncbi:hypothetical protein RND71_007034 [Anisodus tanguticus]|uniref:Uncharacterized protein n=1 Tax=Anisodus tanguticus TaxID=243964 RepID=A0AAE1VT95_9SOLA|nr:hypothetical protein RND71_007034 [Anisodus tanguticus]